LIEAKSALDGVALSAADGDSVGQGRVRRGGQAVGAAGRKLAALAAARVAWRRNRTNAPSEGHQQQRSKQQLKRDLAIAVLAAQRELSRHSNDLAALLERVRSENLVDLRSRVLLDLKAQMLREDGKVHYDGLSKALEARFETASAKLAGRPTPPLAARLSTPNVPVPPSKFGKKRPKRVPRVRRLAVRLRLASPPDDAESGQSGQPPGPPGQAKPIEGANATADDNQAEEKPAKSAATNHAKEADTNRAVPPVAEAWEEANGKPTLHQQGWVGTYQGVQVKPKADDLDEDEEASRQVAELEEEAAKRLVQFLSFDDLCDYWQGAWNDVRNSYEAKAILPLEEEFISENWKANAWKAKLRYTELVAKARLDAKGVDLLKEAVANLELYKHLDGLLKHELVRQADTYELEETKLKSQIHRLEQSLGLLQ